MSRLKYFTCLDSLYDIQYFALKVDNADIDIKKCNIPLFYKECLLAYQELCRKGKYYNNNEDEIIWCNSRLKHNDMSFKLKHWSKSGIKCISDIVHNKTFRISNK